MLTLRGLQRIRPLGHRFSKLMGDFLVARATFNDRRDIFPCCSNRQCKPYSFQFQRGTPPVHLVLSCLDNYVGSSLLWRD